MCDVMCVYIVLYTYSVCIYNCLNNNTFHIVPDKLGKREVDDVELEKRLWGTVLKTVAGPAIGYVAG